MHGSGMQTWEYSPVYALRSYLYLFVPAAIAAPVQQLGVIPPSFASVIITALVLVLPSYRACIAGHSDEL